MFLRCVRGGLLCALSSCKYAARTRYRPQGGRCYRNGAETVCNQPQPAETVEIMDQWNGLRKYPTVQGFDEFNRPLRIFGRRGRGNFHRRRHCLRLQIEKRDPWPVFRTAVSSMPPMFQNVSHSRHVRHQTYPFSKFLQIPFEIPILLSPQLHQLLQIISRCIHVGYQLLSRRIPQCRPDLKNLVHKIRIPQTTMNSPPRAASNPSGLSLRSADCKHFNQNSIDVEHRFSGHCCAFFWVHQTFFDQGKGKPFVRNYQFFQSVRVVLNVMRLIRPYKGRISPSVRS